MSKKIICWWSGGVTSAVACKIAIDLYGVENCDVIMIDTKNEDDDTYRFKEDCARWYNVPIQTISAINSRFFSIEDVWMKYRSLNVSSGAICSTHLKRKVREEWEKHNSFKHQVFGFEFDKKEFRRAMNMKLNNPHTKPIFPLLMFGLDKIQCVEEILENNIDIPRVYTYGFKNNNCFKTGCVQGGIGYWQKMKSDFPDKFERMADMEHRLTDIKGIAVTMLRDQSKKAKQLDNTFVFFKAP